MMRSACVVFALVLGLGSSRAAKIRSSNALAREGELEATWGRELDAGEVSPIKRVVTLLTDMKKQLESEAAKEEEMYEEVSCWCKTNKEEKTQEITDGEAKIAELEIGAQENAAQKGKLGTQIGHLKEDIASAEESLKTARAIREKEKAEFNDVENEMMESITNLKNAIAILGRHQGGDSSLLQLDNPVGVSFQKVLRDVALKYVELVVGRSSNLRSSTGAKSGGAVLLDTGKKDLPKQLISALGGENLDVELPLDLAQRKLAVSARDAKPPEAAFMQAKQPIFKSYSARSSGIYGILTQMLDEFEANLSQEQKDELSKRESFKALEASQTDLIDTSKEKLDALEEEHSSVTKALSDTNEDLGLTTEQRSADVEFLRNMRLKCQDLDTEYAERSKTRSEELAAVSEAISILTADDARDLFAKSVPSFLQEAADTHHNSVASEAMRRSRVVASLRKAAADPMFSEDNFFSSLADSWRQKHTQASTSSPPSTAKAQLATLAVSAQLDSFTKVKEAMDKMIAELKQQQKEEVENKDLCNKDFDENDKATFEKTGEKKDLETKIASLASMIETLTGEVEVATKEIADTKVAVKKASETREKENEEFQTTVNEQRATQAILKKALARLADFYKKKALLQRSSSASSGQQEPPVKFNAYKKNADASPTMNLLEQIIGDSQTLEKEAIAAEQEAQSTYETFVQDSNNIIKDLSTAVISKKKLIAESEGSKDAARASLGEATNELELLEQYKADLHFRCDFLLKNFDIRQHARMQEIEAIQSAKAILSGAA